MPEWNYAPRPEEEDPDLVKNYLANKYGFGPGLDDQALQGAQQQVRDDSRDLQIERGAATIGEGLTGSKLDHSGYDQRQKELNRPVDQLMDRRKAAGQELEFGDKRAEVDPLSPENSSFREYVKSRFPTIGALPNFNGLTLGKGGKVLAQLESGYQKTQAANGVKNAIMGARKDAAGAAASAKVTRQDRTIHAANMGRVKGLPQLRDRVNQFNGLSNAMNVVANAEHLTPEQIDEFQQGIRANMGMKGTSGVEERHATQFRSLGLNAERFREFLTGDPAKIAKDSMLVKHLQELARLEQGNIRSQYGKALKAAAGGHASMYERNPDLKADLEDYLTSAKDQLEESGGAGGGALSESEAEELKRLEAHFGGN